MVGEAWSEVTIRVNIVIIVLLHKKLSTDSKLLLLAIILFCLPWAYILHLVTGRSAA